MAEHTASVKNALQKEVRFFLSGLTFQEYLREGIGYYRKIKHFLSNAFENTRGEDSYIKMHVEEACRSLLDFIQKKNALTEIPYDIVFAERFYAKG